MKSAGLLSNPTFQTILGVLLGCFFVFSGIAKLWSVSSFADVLLGYELIPEMAVLFFAYGIPIVEVTFGVMLLAAYRIEEVSLFLLVLVFVFTVATFVKYQNGQAGNCGCFGQLIERSANWRLFAENTVLMILLATIHYSES